MGIRKGFTPWWIVKGVENPMNKPETREKTSKTWFKKGHKSTHGFKKGHIPWIKGKHHSEESKGKMSETKKRLFREGKVKSPKHWLGKHLSEEHKNKISEGIKGENNPFYGKHHTEETKKKISELRLMGLKNGKIKSWNKGKKCPQISKALKGRPLWKDKKHPMLGKHHTIETKMKISKAKIGQKNPTLLKLNKTSEHQKMCMLGRKIRPNKPERKLMEIINKHSLPFKYVGDGQFILGGKCPDFLNCNGGKQVIEVFGRYWHDPSMNKNVKWGNTYQGTIEHYKKYGFKCLILWENQLKEMNEKELANEIMKFINQVELL